MKKLFTLLATALFAVGANAQTETVILSWNEEPTLSSVTTDDMTNTGTSTNVATWENGYSIMIMRSDKGQSSAKDITVDGTKYKTIKVSNGAQNKLILPEGKVTKKITLYSYVNTDAATDRPSYWKEVAGQTYTEEDLFESYNDYDNPDKREYTFPATNEITFTNTGEQCCYVIFIEVEDGTPEIGGDEPSVTAGRKWDFTAWSEVTVAALKADAAAGTSTGWSDDEKNDGSNMEATAGNCFWAADETVANADGYLTANGEILKELEGLKFMFFNRNLAIAVNYPSTSLGDYHGGAYLWLGGSGKDYFTIPAVAGGSIIKIGVESHKSTDPRGITLTGVDANPEAPTTFEEQTWKVKEGEAVDITVTNTNGCHLYYIEIIEDGGTGIEAVPVKVVSNGAIINLAGQKVDENYKGLVIKNGKKYIQK